MSILEKLKIKPGPWPISHNNYGDEIWFGGHGKGMIEVNNFYAGGHDLTEAKLISQAPAMLEALIDVVMEEYSVWHNKPPNYHRYKDAEHWVRRFRGDEIKIIESATNKTWEEIKEIIEKNGQ
jgi:hypothetical protein